MAKTGTGTVRVEMRDGVVLLGVDHPPVNALSNDVRQALHDGIGHAQGRADVHAIVIHGCGGRFSAGADIREFNGTRRRPFTSEVAALAEDGAMPVVAAIAGYAMGGGLELALGAHARIAGASARLALPEVKLGLLPGGGGTQRLPRLVGVEHALDLILSGRTAGADEAHAMGLLDWVVDDDRLVDEAIALGKGLAQGRLPLRRTGALAIAEDGHAGTLLEQALHRPADTGALLPAHRHIVEAISAATRLPLQEGIRFEHEAFMRCVATPEHRALAEAFFARRSGA